MADKATNGTEDLVQAYNRAVESTIGAVDTSVAQTATTAKLLTDAAEAERQEFGKVLEQGAGQARKRSENLAAVFPSLFQGMAVKPGSSATPFGPEVGESISKLVESEMAFYESWTQAWMLYMTGSEQRRSATAKAIMESNAKVVESSQSAAKGAVEYGGALFNWSVETVNAKKG